MQIDETNPIPNVIFSCELDLSKPNSDIAYNIYTYVMVILGILDIIFYIVTWITISHTARSLSKATSGDETFKMECGKMVNIKEQRHTKTAKLLTFFVLAYFLQWWPFFLYSFWAYVEIPPIMMIELNVIFTNLGGLFNFVAYTFVRRQYRSQGKAYRNKGQSMSTSPTTSTDATKSSVDDKY